MTRISKDIEEIQHIAKETRIFLKKGRFSDVRKNLEKIIALDIDEIRALEDEHGTKAVLQACFTLLNDAKHALITLSGKDFLPEIVVLVDKIMKLEEYEVELLQEEEKQNNVLYRFWVRYVYNFKLYHTTSSLIANEIKNYGFIPDRRHGIWRYITEAANLLDDFCHGLYSIRKHYTERINAEPIIYFTSDIRYSTAFKVPETVLLVIKVLSGTILPHLQKIIETNGNYSAFHAFTGQGGMPENWYKELDFAEVQRLYKKLDLIYRVLVQFEKHSNPVTFYVFARDLVQLKLNKLRTISNVWDNALVSFDGFKILWNNVRDKKVPTTDDEAQKWLFNVYGSYEWVITRPVPAKYVHLA